MFLPEALVANKTDLDDFRVPFFGDDKTLKKFDLDAYDTAAKPFSTGTKDSDRALLATLGAQLDGLQERLHTQRCRRVLLVLQGMDTSGKDGTIRDVFRDVDPLGLRIAPFGAPTAQELAHDFLWRVHAQVPAAGEMTIFNRSHYEDVLVPRVLKQIDADECERRYQHIRQFEALLADSNTAILKCFLHISKDEQRARLQARIDDPTKHWKFSLSDLEARKQWDAYQQAYRDALAATSTPSAPWYVISADSKTHRNVMVAQLLRRMLDGMNLDYPPPNESLQGVRVE
jgi:PPK2 family polyphosphate:nucleotide phosphotransferase